MRIASHPAIVPVLMTLDISKRFGPELRASCIPCDEGDISLTPERGRFNAKLSAQLRRHDPVSHMSAKLDTSHPVLSNIRYPEK